MFNKYHIKVQPAKSRYMPISKFSSLEANGCLGCLSCVKQLSCIYGVYQHKFKQDQIININNTNCVGCMRCVQECKSGVLIRTKNPQYYSLGDKYWRPDIITSIWKQSENGKIPVSGAGYRGPFVGSDFDKMWIDMSEIIRPTRDGIHGREHISTIVELGRKPKYLIFDKTSKLTTNIPPSCTISLPIIFDIPYKGRMNHSIRRAIARTAIKIGTLCVANQNESNGVLADYRHNLIVKMHKPPINASTVKNLAAVELPWSEEVINQIQYVKRIKPSLVTSVRLPLNERAVKHTIYLASKGAEIIHLVANHYGRSFDKYKNVFFTKKLREIHLELMNNNCRDQVTLLVGGGIALAEHVVKTIICGADAISLDTALNIALECRLCNNCEKNIFCPIDIEHAPEEWSIKRLTNLAGAFHSQLIELLGTMGLREIRRLRGEIGRVMFFKDLERISFAPIFNLKKNIITTTLYH